MKKISLILFAMFLGYITNAQIADSLLYQLETDTMPAAKDGNNVKLKISVTGDNDAEIDIQANDEDSDREESDTVRVRIGNKRVIIVDNDDDDFDFDEDDDDNDFKGHWQGLALGMNNYLNPDHKMELDASSDFLELNTNKSWEVGLNFVEKSFNIYNNNIGLITGLGLTFNNYKFEKNITLIPDNAVLGYVVDSVKNFTKNKLTASYLTVPILLEFQIPTGHKDNNFHINAGIVGSLKVGSHTKQMYEVNNKEYKDKIKEDYHLSPLRYGIHTSIGYGHLTIYGSYTMTSLFEKNQGPELYPFSIGIIIGG